MTSDTRDRTPVSETGADERWRDALLDPSASVQDAIRSLERSSLQIVLVSSGDGVLLGTVTDGDIRRGLLSGLDLSHSIADIVNHEPFVVPPHLDRATVLQLMQANKIHQLPIVDDGRRVVGLHLWNELLAPRERPNLIVIMAGGRGERLLPHTENTPKPMLPVGGKPMLEHIIERARADGFRRFVLTIHYLGHVVTEYFGDGGRWHVEIDYLREESPLGTVGGVSLMHPRPEAPFIVTNGDVLTDIRYGELLDFHCRHAAAATMAVRLHELQHPFGVVRTRGMDIVGFEEKPVTRSHVNAGLYVLEPAALDVLTVGQPCDMPTLFTRLQERGARTIVFPMHEPWLDVGRADDLARAAAERVPDRAP